MGAFIDLCKESIAVWRNAMAADKAAPKVKRDGEQLEFLPAALEVLETPASPIGRMTAGLIILLFTLAIIWAWFGKIDTVAVAQGKIVPGGNVKVIQPFEQAVVRAIHVKDGQRVKEGEMLLELDPTEKAVDRERVLLSAINAAMTARRLEATIEALNTGETPNLVQIRGVKDADYDVQRQTLQSDVAAYTAQMASMTAEENRLQSELRSVRAEVEKLEAILPLAEDREQAMATLLERGSGSKLNWIETQQNLVETRQNLAIQRLRVQEVRAQVSALQQQRLQASADLKKQYAERLLEATEEEAQASLELKSALLREQRYQLKAPVNGTVTQLAIHTVGGVVKPADPVMIIVPEDTTLEIEAMVLNKDIGFIHVGQEVAVKAESFNFTKYGLLGGTVNSLSADSIPDEKLGPVYAMRASLHEKEINVDGTIVPLGPGMTVSAEVKTGKRRVLEFFFDKLLRAKSEALRER